MTHVKNVQAFGKLTGICTGYGGQYNPGKQNLQVKAMATLWTKAQQAMEAVNEAKSLYDIATNDRVRGFYGLRKLSSSVIALLKMSGAHELTIQDAVTNNRKIWGTRKANRKANAEIQADEVKRKSTFVYSQDYASIANYFAQIVETISKEPKYQPNEPHMSVEGLQKKVKELHQLNNAVTAAEIRLKQAKRDRDELYYKVEGNLFETALAAKLYVRGIFGYQSSQHLEVRSLRFTKPHF
ncbi:MAG: hypothetical protein KDC99_06285 [Cyclobacteriaceae bacterium]|nr:hypothetical protein [Cyclobacteriaceae bacterium]